MNETWGFGRCLPHESVIQEPGWEALDLTHFQGSLAMWDWAEPKAALESIHHVPLAEVS